MKQCTTAVKSTYEVKRCTTRPSAKQIASAFQGGMSIHEIWMKYLPLTYIEIQAAIRKYMKRERRRDNG